MNLVSLLKAKAFIVVAAGILLVGGATVAFAATPAGHDVVQTLTHGQPTATPANQHAQHDDQSGQSSQNHNTCPGLAEAQNLATKYHLSTDSNGNAVQAICALHEGSFKGMTTSNASVSTSHVYGYGEIDQLLTYAQFLAAHDSANAGARLSDLNVSSLLATALQKCGTSPVEVCVRTNVSGNQHGKSGNGNKPATTPTPNGNKPVVTPTPHH
ncbi:MAG TPA: hypothetical protein VFV38_31505 [Ktedonobacteraceae bacterium]|nr:hypothetical protein [Ktedonobacteraceae bacterium]